jgi:hypothetical protein
MITLYIPGWHRIHTRSSCLSLQCPGMTDVHHPTQTYLVFCSIVSIFFYSSYPLSYTCQYYHCSSFIDYNNKSWTHAFFNSLFPCIYCDVQNKTDVHYVLRDSSQEWMNLCIKPWNQIWR